MKIKTTGIMIIICLITNFLSSISLAAESATKNENLPLKDVQRFTTAISQIKNYYVEEVDDEELFEDAIRGMVSGLDPHSSYLDTEEFSDLRATTSGKFGGLGIEVTMEDGYVRVISPIDDTPAAKAGIKAGDLIAKIDGTSVSGLTLRDAVSMMRGEKGSKINITILRKGEAKPLDFTIVRDIITIQSVKSYMLDKDFAYIRISHFQAPTARDFNMAVSSLTKESKGKLKGLVLDLRNNPGGLLDSAIAISDDFIHNDQKGEEELIVYTKGRLPGSDFVAKASPAVILQDTPMVVLINEGSASGSEIVAGALQDYKRAVIMGTTSFGKGSVQTVLPLDKDSGIKLTTALYYTPAGRSIQAKGIIPDIVVEELKLPKEASLEHEKKWYELKEADLKGHLANGNGKNKVTKNANKKAETPDTVEFKTPAAEEDYQLYEAYNLLKGLSILKKS